MLLWERKKKKVLNDKAKEFTDFFTWEPFGRRLSKD